MGRGWVSDSVTRPKGMLLMVTGLSQRAWLILTVIVGFIIFSKMLLREYNRTL
jgi:hypothetical protein